MFNIRSNSKGVTSRLFFGVTYKGAKASNEVMVEVDAADPVLIVVVYGNTAEND